MSYSSSFPPWYVRHCIALAVIIALALTAGFGFGFGVGCVHLSMENQELSETISMQRAELDYYRQRWVLPDLEGI
jgi:hypothetical protein